MALQSVGVIKFSDINVELGNNPTDELGLSDPDLRTLFDVPGGTIKISTGYGKSNRVQTISFTRALAESSPSSGALYGDIKAMNDTYIAVANQRIEPTHVRIYNRSTGSLARSIAKPSGATNAWGYRINFVGDKLAITDYNYLTHGRVEIWDPSDGTLDYGINSPDSSTYSPIIFGWHVSGDNSYFCVSAPRHGNTSPSTYNGKVYVYRTSDGQFQRAITNPTGQTGRQFGTGLEAKGNYAIVVSTEDKVSGSNLAEGAVYCYNITNGSLVWKKSAPTEGETWQNPRIHISDTYTAVGYMFNERVIIYETSTGNTYKTITNPNNDETASSTDYFGTYVGLTDDYVVIYAPFGSDSAPPVGFAQPWLIAGFLYVIGLEDDAVLGTIDGLDYSTVPGSLGSDHLVAYSEIYGVRSNILGVSGNSFVLAQPGYDTSGVSNSGRVLVFDVS